MTGTTTSQAGRTRWRTVDIVVAAVLAVAFGVIFQGWSVLWAAVDPVFAVFRPAAGIMVGVWLIAGVVGALVIRKPGAAVFVEAVAAMVSALLGSQWGLLTIVYGVVQGLAVELVFAGFRYRRWRPGVAIVAGAAAGVGSAVLDFFYSYPGWSIAWKGTWLLAVVVSGAVVAGGLGWVLVRSLARTGALAPFPAAREQQVT